MENCTRLVTIDKSSDWDGFSCIFSTFPTYLESYSGNITDGVTFTTETGDQNFIVFFNVVQATVPWYESCDFLAVFDQLHSHALTNGRVRLFGFDTTAKRKTKENGTQRLAHIVRRNMIQHGWVQHINIYRLGLSDGPKRMMKYD